MDKIIKIIFLSLLYCLRCFAQTNDESESDDTILRKKIKNVEDIFNLTDVSNLDKIEGIYFGGSSLEMRGWKGSRADFNGITVDNNSYFMIARRSANGNEYDFYEYSDGDFREAAGKWFILRENGRYFMKYPSNVESSSISKSVFFENEVVFEGKNILFVCKTKTQTNIETISIWKSKTKIYPRTLDDNIVKSGTGFFISKDGYVVTNYHVIKGARNIYASSTLFQRIKAQVEYSDEINDIALIKIPYFIKSVPYNIVGLNKDIGESVFTLGFPLSQTMGKEVKLTNGILNSNSGYGNDKRYYQFSAEIQPGNSGGPLFDSQGNIVGLVSAKHITATNAGYALKSQLLIDFIKRYDPSLIASKPSVLKNLNFTSKYKILKDYILFLEIE